MDPAYPQPLPATPRLALRSPPYEPQVQRLIDSQAFAGLSPGNLRLALAHHPRLALAFQALAHAVLFQTDLDERHREIAIIRTGALTRSEYEWGMHVSIYGERCRLTEPQIQELTHVSTALLLSDALWSPADRLVVRVVDELHHHSTVSDETWASMCGTWSQSQIVELIFASGFYHMAAFFLNAAAVPLEHGARRFPPGLAQARVPAPQ
jgi:alkylhydroperoxidase family enzyme